MTERTYKLFDSLEERFNLNRRSFTHIENVCRVMTECDFLSPSDAAYYAQIADFPTEEHEGEKFYRFKHKWSKGNYLLALMSALFVDVPALYELKSDGSPSWKKTVEISGTKYKVSELRGQVDAEEVYSALGFFLASIGWTLHDQSGVLKLLQALQTVNLTRAKSDAINGEAGFSTN
jgi:hypothetical protein